MSEQDGRQVTTIQRPLTNDPGGWKAYWKAQGQPWRTEPEIDLERQAFLTERRSITPDIKQGIYPFKGIKLDRADVEWLLATHENGRGPVDWNDKSQRERRGLDLRGANLNKVDLHSLPLAGLLGGLTRYEGANVIEGQDEEVAILMEKAFLYEAHLEGANLRHTHLEGANPGRAHLQEADLREAHLEGTDLNRTHLEAALLTSANLAGANLRSVFFDSASTLRNAILGDAEHGFISAADVRWAGVNLALVQWPKRQRHRLLILEDECLACLRKTSDMRSKDKATRVAEYEAAVRANRQLAYALQNQGLSELAAHFAYRAQVMQRKLLWLQRNFGHWLFSMLLALLSGYGYRIWRILAAYMVVVSLFALAYFVLGMHFSPHLHLDQAYLESITAFHGRVFFEQFNTNTPQIWLTALEAIAGLIIEGVFIAMLIQRFFGK